MFLSKNGKTRSLENILMYIDFDIYMYIHIYWQEEKERDFLWSVRNSLRWSILYFKNVIRKLSHLGFSKLSLLGYVTIFLIANITSRLMTRNHRISKGSILGLMLFSLNVTDLLNTLTSELRSF